MQKEFLTPAEIAESLVETGIKKAGLSITNQIVLGFLAGAFVAFAAAGSSAAIHTIESVGLAKALAGALFPLGLVLVVLAGAELFTGNCLMVIACVERKISLPAMLRNWIFVYLGNFIGSVVLAYIICRSGELGLSGGMLGGFTIKVAASKVGLSFTSAFLLGLLCNWLVCLAVWLSAAAVKSVPGKIMAVFFPIWLFVASGYEHSIANMYYIPAGIMARATPLFAEQAIKLGVTPQALNSLDWSAFFVNNLFPVTLGNILGGGFFVGLIYWFVYLRKNTKTSTNASIKG